MRAEVNATTVLSTVLRPIALFSAAVAVTVLSASLLHRRGLLHLANPQTHMSGSFILWLHGLGDSGPANEPIRTFFTSPEFRNTKWSFPSAPTSPVSCNCELSFFCGDSIKLRSPFSCIKISEICSFGFEAVFDPLLFVKRSLFSSLLD
ncbi:lysophospholipase II [Dendrobium catenatum]|uniref:Lysophospholipase II n=1 Tax=Dendrobium catenatum TaxID=906689 RepID=A0A2I0V8C4_9ASPA|nr:lysophospholipase II [Dendrobium catenatum]